jgi:hypothetical protein
MKLVRLFSILILVLAFVTHMFVIMPSGSRYCSDGQCGIYFSGAHEHDAVWHLAVSETLFNKFPFEMPNMSNTLMHGYNYLLDIVVSSLSTVSGIGIPIWFFKILPVLWFAGMSYLIYKFGRSYRDTPTFPIFLWFFSFFGSSFSYLLRLNNIQSLWGSSSLLSMQALQDMLNPQFAWSLIPLLLVLLGLVKSKREYSDYVKYGLYTFIAIGLKFYTGTVMLMILGFDLLIQLTRDYKKVVPQIVNGLIVAVITTISIWIFYAPGGSNGFPFIFKPLATVNPIIEDKSLFYLPQWAERLYSYSGLKLAVLEMGVLTIFTILNYGTRILALLGLATNDDKSNKYAQVLIIVGSLGSFLLSIIFIQKGVWWNTVQFLYVSLFLTGILAAEGMDILIRTKKVWSYLMVVVLIILTIPTNIDVMHTFMKFPGTAYITSDEIQALSKLRSMPKGVILAPLFWQKAQVGHTPELSHTYDTAFISAYSGQQTYISDLIQLELTNVEYKQRLDMIARYDCQVLESVNYVYEDKDNQDSNSYGNCGRKLERVFENATVNVYRVK